jgi:hypothetical protein
MQAVIFDKFDGGWNIRDSISGLELNESPDCKNVVIDERGGIGSRLGITKGHDTVLAGAPIQGYYWESQNLIVIQIGAQLYKATPGSNFVTMGAAFSTSARVAMVDFNEALVITHPVDGVFTSDGTTNTLRNATVAGTCIAVWQNKVFVGSGAAVARERVWWSNAGDATVWTTATDFNDIQEVDTLGVVAIGVGQGMDVAGRPGLLVFKRRSTYRINDSATGEYTTLSTEAGAASANAVADIAGLTAFIGDSGIHVTDGVSPPVKVSDQIHPLFNSAVLSFSDADLALWSAGVKEGDTFIFNVKRVGASAPDLMLECRPHARRTEDEEPSFSIVPHEGCAMRWLITVPAATGSNLWGGGTSAHYIYRLFEGGTDDGTAISAYWTSKAFEANQLALWHLVRVRAKGRGEGVSLSTIADWGSAGQSFPLTAWLAVTGEWGVGLWGAPDAFGTGFWGADAYELLENVWNLGTANAFALKLSASTSTATTRPPALGSGQGAPLGAWNCYALRLDVRSLGGA